MVLSHHERRRLKAIEAHLDDDDPDLARQLDNWTPSPGRWTTKLPIILIVIGAIGVLTGLLIANLVVLVASGIIPLCAGLRLRKVGRDPGDRGTRPN